MSVPFCGASNGRPAKLAITLGAGGLIDYFEDRIFTAADVLHGKPAPDLFLLAAAQMGTQPARCVVVEDSASGVAAGQAAGMRVFGYAGAGDPSALEGADMIFTAMSELPRLLQLIDR